MVGSGINENGIDVSSRVSRPVILSSPPPAPSSCLCHPLSLHRVPATRHPPSCLCRPRHVCAVPRRASAVPVSPLYISHSTARTPPSLGSGGGVR